MRLYRMSKVGATVRQYEERGGMKVEKACKVGEWV
jgi:hypothetical protein